MDRYWTIPEHARFRYEDTLALAAVEWPASGTLAAYRDEIASARLPTVRTIVVLPERAWPHNQLLFFAFGTFTSIYRTIELLSVPLARQYCESRVLPVVRPIIDQGKNREPENAELLKRRFSRAGLLLWTNHGER